MTTVLVIVAVLVGALACPAMMWWNTRRGRSSPCCPPRRAQGPSPPTVQDLREEQRRLEAMIADAEARQPSQSPI